VSPVGALVISSSPAASHENVCVPNGDTLQLGDNCRQRAGHLRDLDYAHMPHYPQPAVGAPFQHVVGSRRASKRLPRGPALKVLRVPSGHTCLNGRGVPSSLKPRNGSSTGFSGMMPPLSKNPPGENPIVCVILYLRCRAVRPNRSNAKVQGFLKSCHSRFRSRMQPAFKGDSAPKFVS
jgi:hypothetical protein